MIAITGRSLNGERTYEAELDAPTRDDAYQVLATAVRQSVRDEFGVTPRGVAYLLDPRTVEYEES